MPFSFAFSCGLRCLGYNTGTATEKQRCDHRPRGGRKEGKRMRSIDVHTHVLTDETIGLLQKEAPNVAPKLSRIDPEVAVLEVAGTPYRPFPRGGHDIARRFVDMDAAEVDVHVLSATPQTYYYDQDPSLAATCAALQNDQIAKLVKAHPDRFL